jgi:tRNA dimethylallyltransferase
VTRHLAIVGPTASGKSAIAMSIAEARPDVEIVSLDSMQVYRGMDIGTAKPSLAERADVPHHLVDVVDPSTEWSVRDTQRAASAAIAEIEARGRRALIVGGTGLYVRAVIDGLDVPPRDTTRRAALEAEVAQKRGLADAYERLRDLDPTAAARIEPGNARRVVRALEVIDATGRPFSSFGPGLADYPPPSLDVTMIGVWLPRGELARRIARRFAAMRELGLETEVRCLALAPGGLSRTARQAIGYKEVLAFLDGELPSLDDAFDLAVARTRKFARRQRVWFRRDPRIRWIGSPRNPEDLAGVVLALWEPAGATLASHPA